MGLDQIRAIDHLLGSNPLGLVILSKKWPAGIGRILSMAYGVICLLKTAKKTNITIMSGEKLSQLKGLIKIEDKNPYIQVTIEIFKLRPFIVYKSIQDKSALAALSDTLGIDTPRTLATYLNGNSTVVILGEINKCPAVIHYGKTGKAKESILRHKRGLQIARKWEIDTVSDTLHPQLIAHTDAADFHRLAQARLPGEMGFNADTPQSEFQTKISSMIDFAANLCQVPLPKSSSKNLLEQAIYSLRSNLSIEYLSQIENTLNQVEAWSINFIQKNTLIHGDLWLSNGLFDGNGKLIGVIDWEWASEDGFILYDAMHCLLVSIAALQGCCVISIIYKIWKDDVSDKLLTHNLNYISTCFNVSADDQKFVAAAIWLIIIKRTHIDTGPASDNWLRRHITEPTRSFPKNLPPPQLNRKPWQKAKISQMPYI